MSEVPLKPRVCGENCGVEVGWATCDSVHTHCFAMPSSRLRVHALVDLAVCTQRGQLRGCVSVG